MATTITLDPGTRERLKRYGHAGMTYEEILHALMDRIDEEEFVREVRTLAAEADENDLWVGLEDDEA